MRLRSSLPPNTLVELPGGSANITADGGAGVVGASQTLRCISAGLVCYLFLVSMWPS